MLLSLIIIIICIMNSWFAFPSENKWMIVIYWYNMYVYECDRLLNQPLVRAG